MSGTPRISFFDLGWQYYAAGRYSVSANLIPVAGNVLHHAIEMFLKGALARKGDVSPKEARDDLERLKKLGHKLGELWRYFKATYNDPSLGRFDIAISELNRFENLRYPDEVLKNGMMCGIGRSGKAGSGRSAWSRPEPFYELFLEEIDELVAVIHRAASVNPSFFVSGMSAAARRYLTEENPSFPF